MTANLSAEEQATSQELTQIIKLAIENQGGFINFAQFMQYVLYTPQFGYYSGGNEKIGVAGDFITAPNLTPLFAQTLANQLLELLPQTAGKLFEFGAGTGALAIELLNTIPESILKKYYIIDISAELKHRQQQNIAKQAAEHAHRVEFLTLLPEFFDGIIIGNEVLDAIPCDLVEWREDGIYECGVSIENDKLCLATRALNNPTLLAQALQYPMTNRPYRSELHSQQLAFVHTLAEKITRGGMIFIDYGFDQYEYYHEQRHMGTLMGHYKHHTVDDVLSYLGLMDITAHVNFSAVTEAALDQGLDLIGYTTQANFLINCGITTLLEQYPDTASNEYIKTVSLCQKLLAPQEMGELFKVIAFAKNIDLNWLGFQHGDLCHKL